MSRAGCQILRGMSCRGSHMALIRRTNISPSSSLRSSLSDFSDINNNQRLPGQTSSPNSQTNSKPKTLPRDLIDRYKRGETHPVSALHQLSQVLQFQLDLKETVTTAGVTGFYFAFCAVVDGVQYKTGMGATKKEAKAKAAELALEELVAGSENDGIPSEVPEGPPPLCVREKDSIIPEVRSGRAVIATGSEVIALGTGSSNTRASPAPTGRILHDSHAVVTARRSLMRFLYKNLLLFFSKNRSLEEKSVFQQDQNTKLLSFKDHVTLHLYLSQLPKGAAQIPSQLRLNPLSISAWEVNNQIGLHVVVEGKVFSKFSSSYEQMGSHVVSMSATDKIMLWQVLGFQGALLSHFIEPVYVNSIFIGERSCNDTRGLEVAVNQRVDGITSTLPLYYCVYRPHISLVSSAMPADTQPTQKSLSLNWSHGDLSIEVVDALEGKSTEDSPFKSSPALASRLCKAAMLSRFNLVAKEAQRDELLTAVTYREAKINKHTWNF